MADHQPLIEALSRELRPVRRPAAPWLRAAGWALAALPCAVLATLLLQRDQANWSQSGAWWAMLNIALSFALGALAMVSAFGHSIAGYRLASWKWFAGLVLGWVVTALGGLLNSPDPLGHSGEGTHCLAFMLLAGVPMILLLVLALRATPVLHPRRCLGLAGTGIAAMAAALLGFCHPVHMHLWDMTMHVVAAAVLVGATVLLGRHWIALD